MSATQDTNNDAATIWLAYNEAENRHDLARTTAFLARSIVIQVNGIFALGSAAQDEAAMAELLASYPDYHRHVHEVIAAGPRATVRWQMRGQHSSGGPPLAVAGCSVITTRGGLITHACLYYDGAALDAALHAASAR